MVLPGRWQFVWWWALTTAVGLALAAALFFPIDAATDGPVHKGLAGVAVGLGLGVGQWLFIRRLFDGAGWWIVATLIGFGVAGFALGVGTTDELARRGLTSEVVGFVLGAAAGVAQWVVLRRVSRRAVWWLPASTAAFGLGWFVMWRFDYDLYSDEIVPFVVNLALLVVPFVLISGLTMRWILDSSRLTVPNPPDLT
jgi:hypothetical protein